MRHAILKQVGAAFALGLFFNAVVIERRLIPPKDVDAKRIVGHILAVSLHARTTQQHRHGTKPQHPLSHISPHPFKFVDKRTRSQLPRQRMLRIMRLCVFRSNRT